MRKGCVLKNKHSNAKLPPVPNHFCEYVINELTFASMKQRFVGILLFLGSSAFSFQLKSNVVTPLQRKRGGFMNCIRATAFDPATVRAISLDITGTILVHPTPIMQTYADAAVWARLPNPPSADELKPGRVTSLPTLRS